MWFEDLPEQCPPKDATSPSGVFYRLCEPGRAHPACEDFHSHRALFPTKAFNTSECVALSVSIFDSLVAIQRIKKLAPHRNKVEVELDLCNLDGAIKKTGGGGHYSWWRSSDFDLSRASYLPAKGGAS